MDNIIITGINSSLQISHLITALSNTFEFKDLGPLFYFLGIQIQLTKFGLTLTQTKYASDVLHRLHMENAKPTKSPCCPSVRLMPNERTTLSLSLSLTLLSIDVWLVPCNI